MSNAAGRSGGASDLYSGGTEFEFFFTGKPTVLICFFFREFYQSVLANSGIIS
jgi:hypothetical protein